MENATKALIMVANLMLAVIILSIVVYFFKHISILPMEEERQKKVEQASKFNLEYEVYDKKLMYGVDVISALNKANNNNEKYVSGSFLSGSLSGDEFIIDIIVVLKSTTPLQDTITVKYLDDRGFNRQEGVEPDTSISLAERDYATGDGPGTKFSEIQRIFRNFILPDDDYSDTIYNSVVNLADEDLVTHTIDTKIVGSAGGTEYHLLRDGIMRRDNIANSTELKELIRMTDSMKQYIRNTRNDIPRSFSQSGWSSFEWETALYDLKSRKFRCAELDASGEPVNTGIHYSERTGAIDRIQFVEI